MKKLIGCILCLISQITLGIHEQKKVHNPNTSSDIYENRQTKDYSQEGLKLFISNDTKNTIIIERVKTYQTDNSYILLEPGTRVTTGETLTIGVNIKEFSINDSKNIYRIAIPFSDTNDEITLPVSIMKLHALGMKIQQVRN